VRTLAPVSLSKRWNYVGAQVFLPARPAATDYTARVIWRCGGVAIPLEEGLDWIEIASGQNEQ